MNREVIETNWVQVREFIRDKWGNLSEEDIRQINGRYDQLVAKLQQRYGYSKEEAEDELRKWVYDKGTKSFGQDKPFARPMREDAYHARKEESGSFLKWFLIIGIPLLLLLSYLGYENSKMPEQTTTVRETTTTAAQPSDAFITNSINREFESSGMTSDIRNIRVTTDNGVVTVTGTVNSAEERDSISRFIQNINGVQRVDNQLQVR